MPDKLTRALESENYTPLQYTLLLLNFGVDSLSLRNAHSLNSRMWFEGTPVHFLNECEWSECTLMS